MKENDGDSLGIWLAGIRKTRKKLVEMVDIPTEHRKPKRLNTKKSLKVLNCKVRYL
jgi:hypothetical protein